MAVSFVLINNIKPVQPLYQPKNLSCFRGFIRWQCLDPSHFSIYCYNVWKSEWYVGASSNIVLCLYIHQITTRAVYIKKWSLQIIGIYKYRPPWTNCRNCSWLIRIFMTIFRKENFSVQKSNRMFSRITADQNHDYRRKLN